MNYLALIPIIVELIKLAEEVLGKGTGPEKKKFVLDSVLEAVAGLAERESWLGRLVEVLVRLLKITKAI